MTCPRGAQRAFPGTQSRHKISWVPSVWYLQETYYIKKGFCYQLKAWHRRAAMLEHAGNFCLVQVTANDCHACSYNPALCLEHSTLQYNLAHECWLAQQPEAISQCRHAIPQLNLQASSVLLNSFNVVEPF